VTAEMIEAAMEWYAGRGMIQRYEVETRRYFTLPTFGREQAGADRDTRSRPQVVAWRDAVFKRDHFTCQECKERGGRLTAHHIVPWSVDTSRRCDVTNGVTLCRKCHKRKHRRGWKRTARESLDVG
jgi:hypothetical protein